jgi:hypothetical protein
LPRTEMWEVRGTLVFGAVNTATWLNC